MADASKQLTLPTSVDTTSMTETLPTDRALRRGEGGTGKVATTTADLLTQLGAEQTANRNAASGYAPLDSSTLVPLANLRVMAAASSGAAGEKGEVPAPSAGDQRRPLRGDATFATELELTSVTDATGNKYADFVGTGDFDSRIGLVAASAAGQQARIIARSASALSHVDIGMEPIGRGRVTRNGDPLAQVIRRSRFIQANADAATFTASGFAAPTVTTPGAAASVGVLGTDGYFVSLTNAASAGSVCGIDTGVVAQRQQAPDVIFCFRSALIEGRIWLGLFDSDPTAGDFTDLSSNGIKGAGFWWDAAVHGSGSAFFRAIQSTGAAQTEATTACAATGNTYTVLRLRHLSGANWEYSNFNTSTQGWEHITTQSSNSPAGADNLKLYVKLRNVVGSAVRVLSIRTIDLFQN